MAKSRQSSPPGTSEFRRIVVSEEDVRSAARLLALLAPGATETGKRARKGRSPSRLELVDHARTALAIRERRIHKLGHGFSAEPPFVMLLALYVAEQHEPIVSVTRLTQLSFIQPTTVLRWLEPLTANGWIERRSDPDQRRKAMLSLSEKARTALDDLFTWNDGSGPQP